MSCVGMGLNNLDDKKKEFLNDLIIEIKK